MDCVDYENSSEAVSLNSVIRGFDFYSQIYCSKFIDILPENKELDKYDLDNKLGIYRMIQDVRDKYYRSPLQVLKQTPFHQAYYNVKEIGMGFTFGYIMLLIIIITYCLVVYLHYFTHVRDFDHNFSSEKNADRINRNWGQIENYNR